VVSLLSEISGETERVLEESPLFSAERVRVRVRERKQKGDSVLLL